MEQIESTKKHENEQYLQLSRQIEKENLFKYTWKFRHYVNDEKSICDTIGAVDIKIPIKIAVKSYLFSFLKNIFSQNTFEYYLPIVYNLIVLIYFGINRFT